MKVSSCAPTAVLSDLNARKNKNNSDLLLAVQPLAKEVEALLYFKKGLHNLYPSPNNWVTLSNEGGCNAGHVESKGIILTYAQFWPDNQK
jgi:hypothetical protein